MNKTDYKDMWVFIERDGDSVLPVSLELCSETRRLCDASGEKLVAVIVGSISDGELQRVLDCGVDKIIHVTGTGFSDADVVVAVNTDPEAAIFNYCTYGIVGDMDEVCEAMLAKLGA